MMNGNLPPDWDPHSDEMSHDQLSVYDEMRDLRPVAYSERHQWSLFRHQDIMRVLLDHRTFSNTVSKHLSVPNGMDPPTHTAYRAAIEPFFTAEVIAEFEPKCRQLATGLVESMPRDRPVDIIASFAQTFALQVQCAFMGWSNDMQEPLREWSRKNHEATLEQNRQALIAVAEEFSEYIKNLLHKRRQMGIHAPEDVTAQLMRVTVNGELLQDDEIVSILRNWTAGEIGTIAASIGILIHALVEAPPLQQLLRQQPEKLPEAIDEILRIHGPLIANRRVATCPVTLANRSIAEGQQLSLVWVSANRDEEVFADARNFRWGRDQTKNLLYGAGIHVCPGAGLARLELRVIMEELLAKTSAIQLMEPMPVKAMYPAGGFRQLMVQFSDRGTATTP